MKRKTYNRLHKQSRAHYHIIGQLIFDDFCYDRGLKQTCHRIRRHSRVIEKLIAWLRIENVRMAKEYEWEVRHDFRTGEETYGYKSIKNIEGNLNYISDRFSAEFRLTWLLGVPDAVDKLSENNSVNKSNE